VFLLGIVVVVAFVMSRHNRAVVVPLATVGVIMAFVWIIVRPQGLSPRFFIWAVPVVGLAAAVVVARRPWAALFVGLAVVFMIGSQASSWSTPSPDVARAAAIVDEARSHGLRVCGYKAGQLAVIAYTRSVPYIPPEGPAGCDLIVEMVLPHTKLDDLIAAQMPYVWREPGQHAIAVYSRIPIRPMIVAPAPLTLDAHPRTYP
jgi:hypothetical protein